MRCDLIAAAMGVIALVAGGQDRTAAALRALSPADAYHSTLFKDLGSGRILDSRNSLWVISDLALAVDPPPVREVIAALFCANDAVFSGTVTGSVSHPTSDGAFLFTNYTFKPATVFRRAAGLPAVGPEPVTVVREGGSVIVDWMTVSAGHNLFPSLSTGTTYYLMARYLPRSGAFITRDWDGSFEAASGVVQPVSPEFRSRFGKGMPVSEFEAVLRAARCRQ